jgi:hypothetical protein
MRARALVLIAKNDTTVSMMARTNRGLEPKDSTTAAIAERAR